MQTHLSEWHSRISTQPIPILRVTVDRLDKLLNMRNVQIYDVLKIVEQDPGLAVQLLRCANSKNQKKNNNDIRSIEQAIKVLEISNIKKLAHSLPTIENNTTHCTRNLLLQTFYKAYHSAKQAEHWAKLCNDEMPEEVYCATFMHYLGEMYISIYVPNLMNFIRGIQGNTNLGPEESQSAVLGFTFTELTIELAESWSLPSFVKESLHIKNIENTRSYGVILASEFVQAASEDWYSEKTWGIQLAAAVWLEMKPEKLISDTHKVAASIARHCMLPETIPLANSLFYKPVEHQYTNNKTITGTIEKEKNVKCLTPQQIKFNSALDIINNHKDESCDINIIIQSALNGMHEGLGLNRAVFYLLVKDHSALQTYMAVGVEIDSILSKSKIDLTDDSIFVDILKKQQAIWVNNSNNARIIKRLPKEFYEMIAVDSFFSMSIFIKNNVVGLFYADRRSRDCEMDEQGYNNFKLIAKHTATALEYLF